MITDAAQAEQMLYELLGGIDRVRMIDLSRVARCSPSLKIALDDLLTEIEWLLDEIERKRQHGL